MTLKKDGKKGSKKVGKKGEKSDSAALGGAAGDLETSGFSERAGGKHSGGRKDGSGGHLKTVQLFQSDPWEKITNRQSIHFPLNCYRWNVVFAI